MDRFLSLSFLIDFKSNKIKINQCNLEAKEVKLRFDLILFHFIRLHWNYFR